MDINTTGGNINITGAISSAGTDETLTLDDGTGTGTITLGSSATSGSITLIGDSGITLTGNLVTTDTAGGAIALTGPVTLAGDITVDADANNTSVTFNSTATVNSDDASTKRDLTINTGAGAVAMQGIIGGSVALDAISINAATAGAGTVEVANIAGAAGAVSIGNGATATLTLDGTTYTSTGAQTYEANDINITAGADVTFTTTNTAVEFQDGAAGQIVLSDATDLTITTSGGNITIAPTIAGTDSGGGGNTAEDITLNAGGGTVTLSNTGAAVLATDIGDVTLTGATIALSNSITSTGTNSAGNAATIDINGAVTLNDNDITFTTGGAGIDFSSTIVSGSTTPRALTIAQGTGAVVINGNIGGTANNDVGNITIGATGHNGNITLSGDIGTDSVAGAAVVALGNANTGLITLGGAEYNTSGTQTYTADDYNLNGTAITLTTSNDIVTFNDGGGDGSIDLADAAALTIGTSGANIVVNVPILGTAGGSSTDVTLNGAGNVTVEDMGTDVNDVILTGTTISIDGTIETADLSGSDPGGITLNGALTLAGNVTLDTDSGNGPISVTGAVNASNAGTETLTISSGSGAVDFGGAIGGTTALGDTTINASGTGTIAIAAIGDADNVGAIVGTTAIGNSSTAGITFDGTIYKFGNPAGGSDTVTITATGTGQVIDFTGGAATTVASFGGNAATAGNTITFATGTIDLDDGSNLTITSDGGAISVAGIRGDSSETVTITANVTDGGDASTTETIALTGAIGNLNEIGAVTLNGADGITMSSNITLADSAGADLDVNGKVFISGDVTIDTHNTTDDGTINFSSTIDGVSGGADDDLVILAGDTDAGASLTITGNIGDGVPLTTLKINESAGTVALSIPQIGGGDTAGVTGQVDIGNTNSASVTMGAATYDFGAGNVNITGNTTFSATNPECRFNRTSEVR